MQKRLVRKLDLEMAISRIEPHPSPNTYLEQYTITPEAAAEILYMASYTYGDISGKIVIDLGCGTGRLAIAAALLGASEVVGVDIDKTAVNQAAKNAKKLGVNKKTDWVIGDISTVRGDFDTVLQNPPFGVQKRGADRKFLERALKIGNHVYSLHKAESIAQAQRGRKPMPISAVPSSFLKTFIQKNGGKIKAVYALRMSIPRMFEFHRKLKHQFVVNLYVIEKEQKVY